MKRTAVTGRIGLVALAGLLLPACGNELKTSPNLFSEGFNGSFPGTSWTSPTNTLSPTVEIDGANGFPAPSLKITTATPGAASRTQTTASFDNPNLTISVQIAAQSGGATEIGTGTVAILNATPTTVAFASWNNATGLITFHINGGAVDQTFAVTADTTFHLLTFHVDVLGTATWSIDNGAALVTQPSFPAGMLKVELGATFGAGTAWPSFFFDNINVTQP